tara:strand:+ start:319 stop:498 length:180 start_codon:yes stop_codon:yes gene_type:complete
LTDKEERELQQRRRWLSTAAGIAFGVGESEFFKKCVDLEMRMARYYYRHLSNSFSIDKV